jgi:Domain of unknown function (DUF1788)
MPLLEANFKELQLRLQEKNTLRNTGGDPVYYLVFPPEDMLRAKRRVKAWKSQLRISGWDVEVLSVSRLLNDFFQNHALRQFWLTGEQSNPGDTESVNTTLREALISGNVVEKRILEALATLRGRDRGLLLITDIEALHPYLRIGAIEQRLTGKINLPVVILYPGTRSGQSNLSFLGIYPEDGNYRSTHIGG